MTSRGANIRITGLLLLAGIAWSETGNTQEFCWTGNCYNSLTQAESAMRANYGSAGRFLEAYRTLPANSSLNVFQTHYAIDIKPLEFHAPYAYWSFQPDDHCVNNFPTPDHPYKCNSLAEAAAKADEHFLSYSNVCSSQTTPDGGGYLDYPAGGAPKSSSPIRPPMSSVITTRTVQLTISTTVTTSRYWNTGIAPMACGMTTTTKAP
jgi:hypothetical protein